MNPELQAIGDCNDGAIVARSVGVSANHYISTLNITVEPDMINETIECVHQDLEGNRTLIGLNVLMNTDREGILDH